MVIYFLLQKRSNKEAQVENIIPDAPDSERNDTVTKIRENAAKPKRASMRNSIRAFSFRIFGKLGYGLCTPYDLSLHYTSDTMLISLQINAL